jgi:DNA-binding MarR family transcriptional regulator
MKAAELERSPDRTKAARASELAVDLRATVGRVIRRLREEVPPGELTWSQQKVLLRLEREGAATVSALALAEGVRPQSMGATIAVLKEAGLVAGAPDPDDGRQTVLSLTEACRAELKRTRAAKEDWLKRAIETKLTASEQSELSAALRLVERILET